MKYTVNVYGTVKKQYMIVADNDGEAEDEAYDRFKNEFCVDFDDIETDAWFREEA